MSTLTDSFNQDKCVLNLLRLKEIHYMHSDVEKTQGAVLCFLGNLPASKRLVPTFRNFRNVGTKSSDVGILARKHNTVFNIRRKFEIKNTGCLQYKEQCELSVNVV